jgi:hypothetical protein
LKKKKLKLKKNMYTRLPQPLHARVDAPEKINKKIMEKNICIPV